MDRGAWWATVHGVAQSRTRQRWVLCRSMRLYWEEAPKTSLTCFHHLALVLWILAHPRLLSLLLLLKIIFTIFWLHHVAYGIFAHLLGTEPAPPEMETQSLNHWTAKELPLFLLSKKPLSLPCLCLGDPSLPSSGLSFRFVHARKSSLTPREIQNPSLRPTTHPVLHPAMYHLLETHLWNSFD